MAKPHLFSKLFVFAFSIVVMTVSSGCAKKRQTIFAQGQGNNLETVENWKERFVNLSTGDIIGIPPTTNAQTVRISESVKNMNHLNLVELKVEDPAFEAIIGTPPFRGKANTQGVYQALIKLTDSHLAIYKVAQKEDLPYEEYFYIQETLEDGRVAIPLLAYKIKGFYRIEAERTSDDQESHHLIELEVDDLKNATHLRIDWGSRELFEPSKKLDLFPAEMFFSQNTKTGEFTPHEWYYSETVTEKSLNDRNTVVGQNAISDSSKLSPATKVIFIPHEKELRVVNIAQDERLSQNDIRKTADLKTEATLIIPVQWKEYEITDDGSGAAFKNKASESRKWNQRRYFEAELPEIQATGVSEGRTRLIDIQIDKNYFSFTVMNVVGSKGRKIRYSFLRSDQGRLKYSPRRSFEADRSQFGFFTTEKPFIRNWEYYSKNDFTKRSFINRFNPDQKEISFRLSIESPHGLEDIAEKAVEAWDQAFENALGKNRIRVRFTKQRASLGDLRYNVIHLVDTLEEDGLLGFGPSVSDPQTGEIIAASSNIYINSIQASAAASIRDYLINVVEKRKETPSINLFAQTRQSTHTRVQAFIDQLNHQLNFKKSNRNLIELKQKSPTVLTETFENHSCELLHEQQFASTERDIQKYCPEIEAIARKFEGIDYRSTRAEPNWEQLWEQAKPAIQNCSREIMKSKLLSTLIHELGHNFGLRHNFKGSYDKANFKKSLTYFGDETTAQSSSIMEYTAWDEDRLTETGAYDIAAIRFGYGNQVELMDGSFLNVENKSIQDSLKEAQKSHSELRPFLYCTDEDAMTGMDALCRQHDAGTTPLEIANFYIKQYERSSVGLRYRRALPDLPNQDFVGAYHYASTFLPLKTLYDQWRTQLASFVRKSNRYLVPYSVEEYKKILEEMKKDPYFSGVFHQYYPASQAIYQFLKSIAFESNQYCILETSTGNQAIEFKRLHDQIAEMSRNSILIRNCSEAQRANELGRILNDSSVRVLNEIGIPVESYRFAPYSSVRDLSVDVLGNASTRMFAFQALTSRYLSAQNYLNGFTPSFIDEPNILDDIKQSLLTRVTKGAEINGFEKPQFVFESESQIYTNAFKLLSSSLIIPGETPQVVDLAATYEKSKTFSVFRPVDSNSTDSTNNRFAAALVLNYRVAFAANSKEQDVATTLIQQYNSVERVLRAKPISEKQNREIALRIRKVFPTVESLGSTTIRNLSEIVNQLNQLDAEYSGVVTCVVNHAQTLKQLNLIFKALNEAYAQIGDDSQAIEKLESMPLQEFVQSRMNENRFELTAENINITPDELQRCTRPINESLFRSQDQTRELNAQKTLLLNILDSLPE